MNERSEISELKGVGEKTTRLFHRIGVRTVGDLIRYYPRTYEVFEDPVCIGEVCEGRTCTVTGTVFGRIQVSGNRSMQVTTLWLKDLTGTLKVIWFRMPFLRTTLGKGGTLTLRGRVLRKKDGLVMEHPEIYYPSEKYEDKRNSVQPVYALTAGLTNNAVIKAVRQALPYADKRQDVLPAYLTRKFHFPPYSEAVSRMHFPENKEDFAEARKRFVFEEFLVFILSLRKMRERENRVRNNFCFCDKPEIERFLRALPYRLTEAQKRVWDEIRKDMQGEYVMSRLVQGDVGSGKTVIAFLALLLAGLNGYQGALMAPTEVLARQHFENISGMLTEYGLPISAELLTGSMTAKQKREAYGRIESGEAAIVIGTHALIQEKAVYRNLALVVTDEQHRFGVKQREALAGKGNMPHILVMSATPIPRTLAIILYGDLDISVIDEMPKNRLPIKNCVVDTGYRKKAYQFMKKQTEEGRQCYVICPMVEESEAMEAENVLGYSEMLSEIMGDTVRVGCLHGRMKQQEKDEVMEAFGNNEIQILVSTTVVEVGIDVPNATVIMIENAERFGLAQLHQLRGRVGRGKYQSYCIFMTASKSDETKERLDILNHSNDGFFIAGEDLRLRGPGDLFGIRQSGIMDFKVGDVFQDSLILRQAAEAAGEILREDSKMEKPENTRLFAALEKYMTDQNLESTL
ncbi:MAG TPA: ATP-dependent DNA helicase RecG [Candidatus Mediterraneibacter stercoravium]|uniref:ATP-dependent DNA helicase RecG n=1 Tax=Candidatus Mediterraneibacter stercoravium TaxID=2838685 RepID=A0A9D2GAY4_9FIRM|nr:ATP-dependent DNA helicase RecG [Candidatus Mediterraneibacter stercoravium]